MKCIIFVVMLALAATNASVLPLAYWNPYASGISLTQGLTGTVLAHHAAPLAYSNLVAAPAAAHTIFTTSDGTQTLLTAPHAAHTLLATSSGDTLVAAAPAKTIVAAPTIIAAPSASYVATTRGSQHIAPLPGHVESVSSTNILPAAGTL